MGFCINLLELIACDLFTRLYVDFVSGYLPVFLSNSLWTNACNNFGTVCDFAIKFPFYRVEIGWALFFVSLLEALLKMGSLSF